MGAWAEFVLGAHGHVCVPSLMDGCWLDGPAPATTTVFPRGHGIPCVELL